MAALASIMYLEIGNILSIVIPPQKQISLEFSKIPSGSAILESSTKMNQ